MHNQVCRSFYFLLVLMFCGFWLKGPDTWGFNHFSYMPLPYFLFWMALVAASFIPAIQNFIGKTLQKTIPEFIFRKKAGPFVLTLLCGLMFWFLQSQSFFLGDGYLILNLIDKGTPFRILDNMDFFLHSWIFRIVGPEVSSISVIRWSSIFAGTMAVPIVVYLLKRLHWELWRQNLVLVFFLSSGPVILFFGYIESYTYLYVFMTCFLISGVLYLENKTPLYVASSFFGLALFFHLSAILGLPALLSLLFLKPGSKKWRSFFALSLPPLVIFGISIFIHLHEGYSSQWFHHDFLENRNLHNLFIPLMGDHGFFSLSNLFNQWNLFLLVAPVSLLVVLFRIRTLFLCRAEPRLQFLLIHFILVSIIGLVLERKLGMARDWDLFVAHSGSLYLLAAIVISTPKKHPGKALTLAVLTTVFLTVPWVVLETSESRSLARLSDAAESFPAQASAHAYEELGQFYRERGELLAALEMYDQCILADANHYRYYALRGAVNFSLAKEARPESAEREEYIANAEINFKEAIRRNPLDISVRKNIGKLYLVSGRLQKARLHFTKIIRIDPDNQSRAMLAHCLISIIEQDLKYDRNPEISDYSEVSLLVNDLLSINPDSSQYQSLNARVVAVKPYFVQ